MFWAQQNSDIDLRFLHSTLRLRSPKKLQRIRFLKAPEAQVPNCIENLTRLKHSPNYVKQSLKNSSQYPKRFRSYVGQEDKKQQDEIKAFEVFFISPQVLILNFQPITRKFIEFCLKSLLYKSKGKDEKGQTTKVCRPWKWNPDTVCRIHITCGM